jgi:hypothetical protein
MIPSHLVAEAWRILEQIPTLRADSEPAVHLSDETQSQLARSVQENRFSKEASAKSRSRAIYGSSSLGSP